MATPHPAAARARGAPARSITIRQLRSLAEFRACVALQRATWGRRFTECVPPSILMVSQKLGGVTAGAFDASGRLLGFVFGLTGVMDGRLVHWSDMLAVREDAQNLGIGQRLKQFQARTARALGVDVIYWTFDPLVARNAHLNFNRLGVGVTDYVVDMYGQTGSALHRGLGTDRFVVAWRIGGRRRSARRRNGAGAGGIRLADAPIVNAGMRGRAASLVDRPPTRLPRTLRVEIPPDIHRILGASPRIATEWRRATRRAFLWCVARGYRVTGFRRDPGSGRCFYLLTRAAAARGDG